MVTLVLVKNSDFVLYNKSQMVFNSIILYYIEFIFQTFKSVRMKLLFDLIY